MTERKNGADSAEITAEQILDYLRKLDGDALIDATVDMDRVIQGEAYVKQALWIRGVPREAIEQARQMMMTVFSAKVKEYDNN